jgi:hypothetical protein
MVEKSEPDVLYYIVFFFFFIFFFLKFFFFFLNFIFGINIGVLKLIILIYFINSKIVISLLLI